jgi:hypothetical protein
VMKGIDYREDGGRGQSLMHALAHSCRPLNQQASGQRWSIKAVLRDRLGGLGVACTAPGRDAIGSGALSTTLVAGTRDALEALFRRSGMGAAQTKKAMHIELIPHFSHNIHQS